ncbi:MAG: hypothetical protein EBT93_13420, partial [Alphaproteobacteria bacterium]|nr:hypothetical protein [Alphaproteobacteria bacterium]
YYRREAEKRKAAQQKTPAPADSTDKADGDQDEAKLPADEIYKLARALESNLPAGELQNKAMQIVDLVDKFRKET